MHSLKFFFLTLKYIAVTLILTAVWLVFVPATNLFGKLLAYQEGITKELQDLNAQKTQLD